MNVLLLISLLVSGSLSLTGCRQMPIAEQRQITEPPPAQVSTEAPCAEYRKITAQEAKARLDKDDTITLVDVRTEDEYREKRIAGSLLIPDYDIEKLAPTLLPDKAATILLYCRSGRRSREAAMKLVAMGYTNIYDLGGINDWPYAMISGK